jgi:translocation and assembly module TamB
LSVAGLVILLSVTTIGLYFAASSAAFENFIRRQMVLKLETATGGRVEIASFHWHLLSQEAEAGGLVIHGLEAPGEAPYAQAESVRVRFSVLGFLSPRILLRDLTIVKPQFHLIVYADGSTNQPQPRKPRPSGKPVIDSFFDMKVSHVLVEQGDLHYENRAAEFDFQDRHIPLDFTPAISPCAWSICPRAPARPRQALPSLRHFLTARGGQESYLIEAGVRDLNLSRGASSRPGKPLSPQVHGYLQGSLELTRNAVTLRSLRITASGRGDKDRTLEISGVLDDFAHPRWQAKAVGELDLRLVNPITGYPNAPEGIAHLNLTGSGEAGSFRADGGSSRRKRLLHRDRRRRHRLWTRCARSCRSQTVTDYLDSFSACARAARLMATSR